MLYLKNKISLKLCYLGAGIALLSFVFPLPVWSQVNSCQLSTNNINFGTYDVFSGLPTDSTGQITYSCQGLQIGSVIRIELGKGNSNIFIPRQLRQGSDALNYNLYRDAARQSVWGDGTQGTSRFTRSQLITASPQGTLTIYGRIPSRQNVSAGTYTDSVTVTISF